MDSSRVETGDPDQKEEAAMGWSKVTMWDTTRAKQIANEIANIGVYCGPAAVVWIAAVWNLEQGRNYDYVNRLRDKSLFPDGPRMFFGRVGGFQHSLNDILKRETNNELRLHGSTYHRYSTIHDVLDNYDMPIIVRMLASSFTDGLHYTVLYKSFKQERQWQVDRIRFYWMDNGYYGRKNAGNPGLYTTSYRNVGYNAFTFGTKRVRRNT